MHPSFIARAVRISTTARLAAAIVFVGTAAVGCSDDTDSTQITTPRVVATFSGDQNTTTVGTVDAIPLVVLVSDGDSHGVAGVQVTFAVSGGGSISTTTATTDASGLASVTLTAGTKTGIDSVTATAAGLAQPAVFQVTAVPGAPSAIVAEAGNNLSASVGSQVSLVAEVTDQYGNPVPNETIDWTATKGTVTAQEVSDMTGTAGDVLVLPSTPGQVTVTATIDGTSIKTSFVDTAQ